MSYLNKNTHHTGEYIMQKIKLLDQVRDVLRLKHYSYRTEKNYLYWIKKYIIFHNKAHPLEMGEKEIAEFLTFLAVKENVASSTQNQALNAIVFLYKKVLNIELGRSLNVQWAKKPSRLPVVFTRDEINKILSQLSGRELLVVSLLYGTGLRLMDCLRLRVNDVNFDYKPIIVHDGKGNKDRSTILPEKPVTPLKAHLEKVKIVHESDIQDGFRTSEIPYALEKISKHRP